MATPGFSNGDILGSILPPPTIELSKNKKMYISYISFLINMNNLIMLITNCLKLKTWVAFWVVPSTSQDTALFPLNIFPTCLLPD